MKKQMAMHYVGVRFALTAPNPSSREAPPKQDLAQSLADFRETTAVLVVEGNRARPVDREVGNQRKPN